jgi:hypothetical protein
MKEEQFEAIIGVGRLHSLAVFECDNDFVQSDIFGNGANPFEINADWQEAERSKIGVDGDYGTYKVTGIVTISDDREQWDYSATWEKIA